MLLLRRLATLSTTTTTTTITRTLPRSTLTTTTLPLRRSLHQAAAAAPTNKKKSFAIAFDIDGVLVRGGKPIPGADHVLGYLSNLQQSPKIDQRIPFIFITNGGGCLEEDKAKEITDVFFEGSLPTPVRGSQVMLSHTPMKALVPQYKDKQILALGSKDYVSVCRSYGFENVVTVEDVLHAHPELYPFKTYHKRHDLHKDPFEAIFILHDPIAWAEEIQVVCDVIEGGTIVTDPQHQTAAGPPSPQARKPQIPLYSSNSDLVFSSTYSVPRLAQGSFLVALNAVYKTCYGGKDIGVTRYGKPFETSYRHAERMLVHEARLLGLTGKDPAPHQPHTHKDFPIKTVYAIGDNPLSDVEGANSADGHICEWVSILVRSGVFKDDSAHPAKYVVDDVRAALALILELEGRKTL